ncbi:GNAT family N-acetyltransferase [Pseudomonas vanderleydeniana]|uniref:N-acetyltransferase n=1 Tax=Pseudomonas vanderleydeniana TaxID=2745495 RepID=A0A9E6TS82_9PSED|nr:GNAT family N-acetyltransferase [Pseudomonas vanderleydeniana]QXI28272.1 N-acetyltransferase [Pseudomonas vanderleydeniana]
MYSINLATAADIEGIAQLLQANAPSRGGSLTGEFPLEKVRQMALGSSPVVIALRDDTVVGVLFSAAKDAQPAPPSIKAMLAAWPGSPDAYVYGPACVAATERGQGLLAQLYTQLQRYQQGREAILFIRRDNTASLRAHARLGMHEVASFTLEGEEYAVLSDTAH